MAMSRLLQRGSKFGYLCTGHILGNDDPGPAQANGSSRAARTDCGTFFIPAVSFMASLA